MRRRTPSWSGAAPGTPLVPADQNQTRRLTRFASRGDSYPQWRSAAGNIYCDEGNHWDIRYY
jgi:hypothetical protein